MTAANTANTTATGAQAVAAAASTAAAAASTAAASKLAPADLKTVNGQSLAGAGNLVIAAAGSAVPTRAAFNSSVNLTSAAGIVTPLDPAGKQLVSTATTIVPGARLAGGGGVNVGSFVVAAAIDLSAWQTFGLVPEVGYEARILFEDNAEPPVATCVRGPAVDLAAPLIGAPAIADNARTFIDTPITEPSAVTLNGTLAGVTLTGFAGKTATAVSVVAGPVLRVTLSAAAAHGDAGTIAFAPNMLRDASNNLSVVKNPVAVTNNIALLAPGAPVVSPGANTSSAINGTIAAGPGSVPVSYTLFYRTGAAAYATGATIAYAGASTPFSITGTPALTSYDVKAQANNATGASADSNVMTSSTTAAAANSITITKVANAGNGLDATGAQTYWARYFQNNSYTGAGIAFGPTAATADVFVLTNMTDNITNGNLTGEFQNSYGFDPVTQASVQTALSHVAASGAGGRVRVWVTLAPADSSTQGAAHRPRVVASFANAAATGFAEIDLSIPVNTTPSSHVYDIVFQSASSTVLNFGYEDPAPGLNRMAFNAMAFFPAP